jgi:tRNA-dihydrouridine synthase B
VLDQPWDLGGVRLPNRVVLAPLAGIGNWFIRMQARRHGAGLAVSEMVSSFGIKYGDKRTLREFLRIHPDEHPVSIQLFGHDPDVMRIAAEKVREAGAALIDINMGCPVKKVVKTGAGASLLEDPGKAVAIARAAIEGSGLPVTVKLRSGLVPGDRRGLDVARRLVEDAGVAGIALHPRHASQQHKGRPDYDLAAELVQTLGAPVLLTGGMSDAETIRAAHEHTGAAAVLLARGSLGNPWLFEQVLGVRDDDPSVEEIVAELGWVIDRAEEHFGVERAGRWMRKAYPWYGARLGLPKRLNHALCMSETTDAARVFLMTLDRSAILPALSHA